MSLLGTRDTGNNLKMCPCTICPRAGLPGQHKANFPPMPLMTCAYLLYHRHITGRKSLSSCFPPSLLFLLLPQASLEEDSSEQETWVCVRGDHDA